MKTKRTLVVVMLLAIIGGGIAFYMMFGFYRVKAADGTESNAFVRKTNSFDINDVVAYWYPLEYDTKLSSRNVYVSRVVGVTGDIIMIDDGILYRNNKQVTEEYATKHRFRASVDSASIDFNEILSKYDVKIGDLLNDGKACDFVCTETEFEKIQNAEKKFSACRKIIDRDDWKDVDIFPSSAFFAWNKDNFGPMYLPKQGDTLNFTPRLAPIYKNIISLFEGNDFQSDTYHVRINQQEVKEYIPKKNYCFILNDDRTDKRDSRSYGPIPQEYIIGKVIW